MDKPRGCAECLATNKPVNEYGFSNILGQQFVLFVCIDCINILSDELNKMSNGQQSTILTALSQKITGTNPFK